MAESEPTGTIMDYAGHSALGPGDKNKVWREREHVTGVSFIAPWEDPFSGFPEHARRCARALDDAGLAVHLRSLDPGAQWGQNVHTAKDKAQLQRDYQDLLTRSVKSYLVGIDMVVADDAMLQRLVTHRFLDPEQLKQVNSFKIISTVFERDRVSPAAVTSLNSVAQVWVGNPADVEMLVHCGVIESKLRVVPIPFFPTDPHLALAGRTRAPGPVRFYHIGKWEHRKAHHEMIGSFLLAFKPGEAKLCFKTSTKAPDFAPYPSSPQESIHRWLQNERVKQNGWDLEKVNENIFMMMRFLSAKQMTELHRIGDVYLSMSRGEGFDMPAYDAKLAGNLMVYTPSGGPQSFAQPTDLRLKPSGTVECHPFYRWGDARYLTYDVNEGAAMLRKAKAQIESGYVRKAADLPGFTAEQVGQNMRKFVEQVAEAGSCG
jgi:hypothetical protein